MSETQQIDAIIYAQLAAWEGIKREISEIMLFLDYVAELWSMRRQIVREYSRGRWWIVDDYKETAWAFSYGRQL